MTYRLKINMDNAAFDNPLELARILRKLAELTDQTAGNGGNVLDYNGNTVGIFKIVGKR